MEGEEPTAGPSGLPGVGGPLSTPPLTATAQDEDVHPLAITPTAEGLPGRYDDFGTPMAFVGLSDESDSSSVMAPSKGKERKTDSNRRITRAAARTSKKILIDSDDEEPEGAGLDAVFLLSLNVMSANEVAAKARAYIKTIEEIRIKCGRLQGALSGKIRCALESLTDTITSLTRKANEKGDIAYLRNQNIELARNNSKISGDMELMKQELEVYRSRGSVPTNRVENCTQTDAPLRGQPSVVFTEGRKRRRYDTYDDFTMLRDLQSESEPWTSEGEQILPMDTEDEIYSDRVRECTKEAGKIHTQTETVIDSAKRTRRESGQVAKKNEVRSDTVNINNILLELKSVIEKHIGGRDATTEKIRSKKPIIKKKIENVQIDLQQREKRDVTWADVTRKGDNRDSNRQQQQQHRTTPSDKVSSVLHFQRVLPIAGGKNIQADTRRRRPSAIPDPAGILDRKSNRPAAVSITTRGNTSHKEVMIKAKKEISLRDIGIDNCKIRTGFTGGIVLEIPGQDADKKADILAERLRGLYPGNEDVRINRPKIKAEIKIVGIDESVSHDEIKEAMSLAGNCVPNDVKISATRRTNRGTGLAWIQCPVEAAMKILENKNIIIGWTTVTCALLESRPLRCFRCLELGHSRNRCNNQIDRSDVCFNCGVSGHTASACTSRPHCVLCEYYGRSALHRLGGEKCFPPTSSERRAAANRRSAGEVGVSLDRGYAGAAAES